MLRIIISNKKLLIGIIIISIMILLLIFGTLITPYNYEETSVGPRLQGLSIKHLFGVDHIGRDLFSRVIIGTRTSMIVAISVSFSTFIIGTTLGALAGYYNNTFLDVILNRIIDTLFSIPWVLTGIVIALLLNPGVGTVIISLTIIYSPQMARTSRSAILGVKELDFITAAKLCGESDFTIITKYILPNCYGTLIVQSTLIMSYSILSEAALSFLGYGVRPPTPSWGLLLQDSMNYLWNAPFLVVFPGLAIIFGVLGFNFLGDGLRDIFDPRYRRTFMQ